MKVFSGNSNPALAEKIAQYLGVKLGEMDITRFPDGEICVRVVDSVRGEDVFIIQSICYPPNENLMELLIIVDAMKRASPSRITAVIPYYGYARQDRKDRPRVPITAKLVANLLVAAGTNRLLTVDLHAQQIQGFFDIPVDHLYASPIIVKHLKQMSLENPIIVAPDVGGVKAAYAYSQMLNCGLAIIAKQRKSAVDVEAMTIVGDVKDCTAVMIDDLTTTGGTLCAGAALLKQNGAKKVYGVVTHAPITPDGLKKLCNSHLEELIVTDTIPLKVENCDLPIKVLSIAELLGEAIRRINENKSINSLFRL